jgi:Zn-finger nucleic acid-binding protein
MNRVNFAHYSNVIVDVCKAHGTWFDRDELRKVIEFIRAGGLDNARNRELAEREEREARLKGAQSPTPWASEAAEEQSDLNRHTGISLLANELRNLWR